MLFLRDLAYTMGIVGSVVAVEALVILAVWGLWVLVT